MIRDLVPIALAAVLGPSAAFACGFHGFAPAPSIVEQLLASEHVVLARSAPDDAFRFQAVEAMIGSTDHVDIPFLVDSATRRKLNTSPETSVLFAREGAYGPWKRLMVLDAASRPVLDEIAARLADWQMGGDEQRFALFAGLLDHPNRDIRNLALRELDQADYGQLKTAVTTINAGGILSRLDNASEVDLKPIRVLLLGLSGDEAVAPLLKQRLVSLAGSQGQLLGAYATAYVALAGPQAVATITDTLLTDADIPADSRDLFIEALALNAVYGDDDLRTAVQDGIARTLVDDPALAPTVARQFGSRGDWSLEPILADILASGASTSAIDAITLSQYVALAKDAQSEITAIEPSKE